MSHWLYEGKEFSEPDGDPFGFVYIITNTVDNRKYIGRKYFKTNRKKPLTAAQKRRGRKRSSRVIKDSDWRTYCGSSQTLKSDIERLGKDKFKFEILAFGDTKGEVNYLEMHFQVAMNALLDESFYNESIGDGKYRGIKNREKILEIIKKIRILHPKMF